MVNLHTNKQLVDLLHQTAESVGKLHDDAHAATGVVGVFARTADTPPPPPVEVKPSHKWKP